MDLTAKQAMEAAMEHFVKAMQRAKKLLDAPDPDAAAGPGPTRPARAAGAETDPQFTQACDWCLCVNP